MLPEAPLFLPEAGLFYFFGAVCILKYEKNCLIFYVTLYDHVLFVIKNNTNSYGTSDYGTINA